MNIKRKLQRLWQRLFLSHYVDERIYDKQFTIIMLTDCKPKFLLPSDVWELEWSRRCIRRYRKVLAFQQFRKLQRALTFVP